MLIPFGFNNLHISRICSMYSGFISFCKTSSYCWFEWNADIDSLKPIFDAAKTKLGIKEYGIVDFIKDADTEKLNLWIQNADAETYTGFMTELNSHSLLDVSSKIKSIKLFKFSDGSFYSYDDIIVKIVW